MLLLVVGVDRVNSRGHEMKLFFFFRLPQSHTVNGVTSVILFDLIFIIFIFLFLDRYDFAIHTV